MVKLVDFLARALNSHTPLNLLPQPKGHKDQPSWFGIHSSVCFPVPPISGLSLMRSVWCVGQPKLAACLCRLTGESVDFACLIAIESLHIGSAESGKCKWLVGLLPFDAVSASFPICSTRSNGTH